MKCQGCGEEHKDLIIGYVKPYAGGQVEMVQYCNDCWDAVDSERPSCDYRRATPREVQDYYTQSLFDTE